MFERVLCKSMKVYIVKAISRKWRRSNEIQTFFFISVFTSRHKITQNVNRFAKDNMYKNESICMCKSLQDFFSQNTEYIWNQFFTGNWKRNRKCNSSNISSKLYDWLLKTRKHFQMVSIYLDNDFNDTNITN